MKTYKLIALEDLVRIGRYVDRIADLFPTDSIPELIPLKRAATEAFGSVQDAGQEGLVHAKLDAILEEVFMIGMRHKVAEEIAGPRIPTNVQIRTIGPVIPQGGVFEDVIDNSDPEFDNQVEDSF